MRSNLGMRCELPSSSNGWCIVGANNVQQQCTNNEVYCGDSRGVLTSLTCATSKVRMTTSLGTRILNTKRRADAYGLQWFMIVHVGGRMFAWGEKDFKELRGQL